MHECIGRDDVRAREGHYIEAPSELEAMQIMAEEFPRDRHGFTAQLWKANVR